MKHHESPPTKPSIEEAPKWELKALQPHMRHVFLGKDDTLLVIIACLIEVLKRIKRAIGLTIADIIWIPRGISSHKIQLILE